MGYIYAIMWMLIGVVIFFRAGNINKVFYLIAVYFEFLGIWWLVNEIMSMNLFEGFYLIIFRIVSALVLVLSMFVYFREKRKNN